MTDTQKSKDDIILQDDTTSLIEQKVKTYEKYDLQDHDLWESFQIDFREFTAEIFGLATRPALLMLRKFLRNRGVYVLKKARYSISKSLAHVVLEDEPTKWTKDLIDEHLSSDGPFNSHSVNFLIKTFAKETKGLPLEPNPITTPILKIDKYDAKAIGENPPSENDYQVKQSSDSPKFFPKELTALPKLYSEEVKYSGEDDNFDFKLAIFHDLCERSGV